MTDPHDGAPQAPRQDEAAPEARPQLLTPTVRLLVAGLLTALLAAAVVVGVLSYRSVEEAEAVNEDRREVVRVAETFAVRFNTYRPETIEEYRRSVNEVLSTNARTAFTKVLDELVATVRETELSSKGKVLASGVAGVDQDSAEVLVVADADADSVFGPRKRHFRWEVALVQVDGEWLVDDFTPVA